MGSYSARWAAVFRPITITTCQAVIGAIALLLTVPVAPAADSTSETTTQSANATQSLATAEGQAAALNDEPVRLKEVVVTAEKRSQRLQDVPAAISALTGATLEAMGAQSFTDYARSMPGLAFTDQGDGRQTLSMRGLSATTGSDTVGYYIGDVPLESDRGGTNIGGQVVNPDLVDIDRIEVLRGPQGTLYGSSSMGGTIKLIPNAPNLTQFEGSVQDTAQVTQGAGGASPGDEGDLILNVPVVNGTAAVRGVFWGRDVGGFIDRTYGYAGDFGSTTPLPQGTAKNIADEHTWGTRIEGLYQPTERLTLSSMIFVQKQLFNGSQDITSGVTGTGALTNPNNQLVQELILDTPESQDNQLSLYAFTAHYDSGRFNFVSATGYYINSEELDVEGTSVTVELPSLFGISPAPAQPFASDSDQHDSEYNFTEEARVATSKSIYGFDAILGVFYSNLRRTNWYHWSPSQYNSVEADNDPGNPLYATNNDLYGEWGNGYERQKAAFGEITYHVTDALQATLGLRHYEITNSTGTYTNGLFNGNATSLTNVSGVSVGNVHKVNVSYNITPDDLVYATYSEGFRPGFGNTLAPPSCDAPPSENQVEPDSIKNYELGAKTAWLQKSLTVNAAAYRINWADIQQRVFLPCGFSYTANSGEAVIKGLELEVNDQLTRRLSAGFSGDYIRAQLQQNTPPLVCLQTGSCAMAGDQLEAVPNWQFSLYAQSTFPVFSSNDGFVRLDYQYTGHSFDEYIRDILSDGTPSGPIYPEYEMQVVRLLNLKTGLQRNAWEVSLSVTNLLNQISRQAVDAFDIINIPDRPRYVVNRPRTFLLHAVYSF